MGSFNEMRIAGHRVSAFAGPGASRPPTHCSAANPAQSYPSLVMMNGDPNDAIGSQQRSGGPLARPQPMVVELVPQAGTANSSSTFRLGSLEVIPTARTLFLDGAAVDLGGRAFDLLVVLLEACGEVVSKEDLLSRVWPNVTVVESNLKVQLSLLRRALGPERWRVKTVSGRGYLLIGDDGSAGAPTPPTLSTPSDSADKQLVILVDADPSTQEMIVRALSDVAKYFTGITRLALISPEGREHALAL